MVYYFRYIHHSALGWQNGIGGKSLINDGIRCTIPIPTFSSIAARDTSADYIATMPECENIDYLVDFSTLPENLQNRTDLKMIGYPRVEYYDSRTNSYMHKLQAKTRSEVIDMDDLTIDKELKDSIEFKINVTDPTKHLLDFHIVKNESRAETQYNVRQEVLKNDDATENTDRIDQNV